MQKNDSKNHEMVQKFAVQRNADLKPCRARKMLKNAPTLAIGGADTAENGPSKVRQVSNKIRRILGTAGGGVGARHPDSRRAAAVLLDARQARAGCGR